MLEALAREQERPALTQESAPTRQGPEQQGPPTASASAHPKGQAVQPGQAAPTWRCQRRPRCSRSGCPPFPPGTRGRQARGAPPPRRQELWDHPEVRGRDGFVLTQRTSPPQALGPHPCLLASSHTSSLRKTPPHPAHPHQLSTATAAPSRCEPWALRSGHDTATHRPLLGGAGKAGRKDVRAHRPCPRPAGQAAPDSQASRADSCSWVS